MGYVEGLDDLVEDIRLAQQVMPGVRLVRDGPAAGVREPPVAAGAGRRGLRDGGGSEPGMTPPVSDDSAGGMRQAGRAPPFPSKA